jgi:predicted nucleic acid-binding Zn finger protein
MTNDNPQPNESIASRTERALVEPLTVLDHDETPVDDADTTIVTVTSASGSTYDVDVRAGACSCPDARHRDPDGGCKHVRRARVALGRDTVDARTIREVDVDPQLAAFAPGPRVATSDGGIIDAGDDGEVIHDETGRVDDGSDDTDGDDDAAEPSPLAEEIAEVAPFARDE